MDSLPPPLDPQPHLGPRIEGFMQQIDTLRELKSRYLSMLKESEAVSFTQALPSSDYKGSIIKASMAISQLDEALSSKFPLDPDILQELKIDLDNFSKVFTPVQEVKTADA